MKWVFLNRKERNQDIKKFSYKIRARKEGKLRCGKPNETTEMNHQVLNLVK